MSNGPCHSQSRSDSPAVAPSGIESRKTDCLRSSAKRAARALQPRAVGSEASRGSEESDPATRAGGATVDRALRLRSQERPKHESTDARHQLRCRGKPRLETDGECQRSSAMVGKGSMSP